MKAKFAAVLVFCSAMLLSAVPALAHHSFAAEFDHDKPIKITGTLTKIDWMNPHIYMYLDSKDANGNTVKWAFESLPPVWFHNMGLERKTFTIGDTVTITGYGSKDGTKTLGWIKIIQFSDGRTIQVTSNNPNETTK